MHFLVAISYLLHEYMQCFIFQLKHTMLFHTARAMCIAWSPDSSKIVSGGIDTNICVWDTQKGTRITMIKGMVPPPADSFKSNTSTCMHVRARIPCTITRKYTSLCSWSQGDKSLSLIDTLSGGTSPACSRERWQYGRLHFVVFVSAHVRQRVCIHKIVTSHLQPSFFSNHNSLFQGCLNWSQIPP